MGVNYFVHLGVGPDLEQMRKFVLDFDQRPSCRDFEDKCRIAE